MKKISKKNLELDKEVIASLSENEMVKATGGGNPNGRVIVDKSTQSECTSQETDCGTRGVVCGGETGYCVTIPPVSGGGEHDRLIQLSIDFCMTDECVVTDNCAELNTDFVDDTTPWLTQLP